MTSVGFITVTDLFRGSKQRDLHDQGESIGRSFSKKLWLAVVVSYTFKEADPVPTSKVIRKIMTCSFLSRGFISTETFIEATYVPGKNQGQHTHTHTHTTYYIQ